MLFLFFLSQAGKCEVSLSQINSKSSKERPVGGGMHSHSDACFSSGIKYKGQTRLCTLDYVYYGAPGMCSRPRHFDRKLPAQSHLRGLSSL